MSDEPLWEGGRPLMRGECGCPDLGDGWEYWTGDEEVEEALYEAGAGGYRSDKARMTDLLDRSNYRPGTQRYSGGYQFGRLAVGPRRRYGKLATDPGLEERVRELWAAGMPILEMAEAVGANAKTLSSWVRRMGLPKRKRGRKLGWIDRMGAGEGYVKICRTCTRVYQAVRHDQHYCGAKCRRFFNRRLRDARNRGDQAEVRTPRPLGPVEGRATCKTCGRSFPAGVRQGRATYCTRDCFHLGYRRDSHPSGWEQRNAADQALAERVAAGRPTCVVCGGAFTPYYVTQVCCNVVCLTRHETAKVREAVERVRAQRCPRR